jgi:LmbE family N-acetylglucosaminyl deacetylase
VRPRAVDDALLSGRLVVLSPHFDDAALSLGATIAYAAQRGAKVTVLTVLGGDPGSRMPAGRWDAECGFSSAGEAARRRREEDLRACEILGAEPVWLPFWDEGYDRGATDDEIWANVAPVLDGADRVFVPGYPLTHEDHIWLSRLILERSAPSTPVTLYVEQPYANFIALARGYSRDTLRTALHFALATKTARQLVQPHVPAPIDDLVQRPVLWLRSRGRRAARAAKKAAIAAYVSQLPGLGRRLRERIGLYERAWGGEGLGMPGGEPPPMRY